MSRNDTSPHRLLLLEDNALIGMFMATALRGAGYDVSGPHVHLDRAQAAFAAQRCDIAVLDINIHGDTSLGLAQHLLDQDCPVIFVSGYDDAAYPTPAGAKRLTKPVDMPQLLAMIADTLAAR